MMYFQNETIPNHCAPLPIAESKDNVSKVLGSPESDWVNLSLISTVTRGEPSKEHISSDKITGKMLVETKMNKRSSLSKVSVDEVENLDTEKIDNLLGDKHDEALSSETVNCADSQSLQNLEEHIRGEV